MSQSRKKLIKDYLVISIGSIIFAFGLNLFAEPFQIAPGGVSGIAIIINYFTDWPLGTMIIVMNIPLFALGIWKLGWKFLFSSLYAMLLSSVVIDLTAFIPTFVEEPLLAALYGGLTIGFGVGLVFARGATTGGLDILVRLLRLKLRNLKLGKLMFLTDLVVIMASAIAFKDLNRALYAIVTVYVIGIVMDRVIYGMEPSKVVYVMSRENEAISSRIQDELERGVTFLHGEGGYSHQHTNIIMSAIKQTQMAKVYDIVHGLDPEAFVIVTEAHEVLGDGFKRYGTDDL